MTSEKDLTEKLSYEDSEQENKIEYFLSRDLPISAFTETEKMFTKFLRQYVKDPKLKHLYFDPKNYEILLNKLKEYKEQPNLPFNKETQHQFHKETMEMCKGRLMAITMYNAKINDDYEEKADKILDSF